jgi:hypothetical protein
MVRGSGEESGKHFDLLELGSMVCRFLQKPVLIDL